MMKNFVILLSQDEFERICSGTKVPNNYLLKSVLKNKSLEVHCRTLDSYFQSNDEVSSASADLLFLTILTDRWKLCFTQFRTRIYWNTNTKLAASELSHMFTQSVEFYIFHFHFNRVQRTLSNIFDGAFIAEIVSRWVYSQKSPS